MAGGEETFAEVTADDFFGVADGGEVSSGVPFEEQVEIDGELREDVWWRVEVGCEERGDCGFCESRHEGWFSIYPVIVLIVLGTRGLTDIGSARAPQLSCCPFSFEFTH